MPPAGFHYTIVVLGAMDWLFKALSSWLINRLKNLVACESGPRLEPIAEQFPHSYTKRLSKRVLLKMTKSIVIRFAKLWLGFDILVF